MADPPRIQIEISEDGLEAVAQVRFGPACGFEDVQAALSRAHVRVGVDAAACEALGRELARDAFSVEDFVLASGEPADPGRDGVVELDFEPGLLAGRTRDDDSMDFLDREFLKSVQVGEQIAVYVPPTEGTPGRTVDGKAIEVSAGKEALPTLGPGVELQAAGKIVAARTGAIQYRAGQLLDVVLHHDHSGDVDAHSGHLKMEGSVSVQRCIQPNFMVRATDDVEVGSAVDAGRVYAGRDIRVGGGVIGGDKGKLDAKGNITARHLQSARLYANGRIEIRQHAVNSELHAGEIAVAGRMLGGRACAETRVAVADAGSEMGVGTQLVAARPVERPCDRARQKLAGTREPKGRRRGGLRHSSPAVQPKGGKWGRESLRDERSRVEHRRSVRRREQELLVKAVVEISGSAHEGVEIQIGDQRRSIEVGLRAVRFVFDVERGEICMEKIRS